MTDNFQAITAISSSVVLGLDGKLRADVSSGHIPEAKSAVAAVRTALDQIDLLLDTQTQDTVALGLDVYPQDFYLERGVPFSYQFVAHGGFPPYLFVDDRNNPAGITLSPEGELHGTPEAYGDRVAFPYLHDSNPDQLKSYFSFPISTRLPAS